MSVRAISQKGRSSYRICACTLSTSSSRLYATRALPHPDSTNHEVSHTTNPHTQSRRPATSKLNVLHSTPDTRSSGYDPDKWLLRLAQSSDEPPTLLDLENCKPERHASPDSQAYILQYHELVDTLCRTFSKAQLREFLVLSKVDGKWHRSSRKKIQLAEAIIEQRWKWPNLKDVEKAKRDRTEVSVSTFLVSPSELFLILGKDGVDLLAMSKAYNAHISLSSKPLSLRVEGFRGQMRDLAEHLAKIKKEVVSEVIQLPVAIPVREDLIQRISRLAGAYVENVDSLGKVRISAKNDRDLLSAKRLAARASHEIHTASQIPQLTYRPTSPPIPLNPAIYSESYALYPFLTPRSLPWTMNTAGAFRLRRVGEWLINAQGEDLEKSGGLAGGKGKIITSSQTPIDVRKVLQDCLPVVTDATANSKRIVKASLGHVLFNTASSGQRATLVPPLKGHHQHSIISKWIKDNNVRASFVSGLAPALLTSRPSKERILHRVVYHTYRETDADSKMSKSPLQDLRSAPVRTLTFEVAMTQVGADTNAESEASHEREPSEQQYTMLPGHALKPECWIGEEQVIDVMMPDRTMDMRLSSAEVSTIQEPSIPVELQQYMADLQRYIVSQEAEVVQPDVPLTFEYQGESFILHSSTNTRQNIEADGSSSTPQVEVVSESVVDLESGQKSTRCEVVCLDAESDEGWNAFLQKCDQLTTSTHKSPALHSLDTIGEVAEL